MDTYAGDDGVQLMLAKSEYGEELAQPAVIEDILQVVAGEVCKQQYARRKIVTSRMCFEECFNKDNKFKLSESAVDDLNTLVDRHEEELPLVSKSVAADIAIFSLFQKLGKDESRESLAKRTSAVLRSKKVGSLRLYDVCPPFGFATVSTQSPGHQ